MRARLGEQIARNGEPVSQVCEVRVDAEFPRVAKCLDLLDLAGSVLKFAVLNVSLVRGYLPVRAKLDAVWWINVDHLDLAAEVLLLGE